MNITITGPRWREVENILSGFLVLNLSAEDMEHFELPEIIVNTVRTVCSDMNFTWNIHHGENRVSATLIWTRSRTEQNGGRHFEKQHQPRDQPAKTSGSMSPGGRRFNHPENPALEKMIPGKAPRKSHRKHKSPSPYRRDQRRLREFKARKRQTSRATLENEKHNKCRCYKNRT